MTKDSKSVPGIDEVKKMESIGDFDVDTIVKVIEANKDIINKVEGGREDFSIKVNLNLSGVSKLRLADGITDLFKNFRALSVDMICDNGVRTLQFWWDSSAREI